MTEVSSSEHQENRFGVEWWYAAHFAYGAIQVVFIPILIPTFVLEVTGSATMAGSAMALIGMGGLAAPFIGGLADKYRAHRLAQLAGLVAYIIGGLLFALMGQSLVGVFAGAACMGVGSATLLMINPAFIVSAGFEADQEATRLTRLNQTAIVGSLIFGILLGQLIGWGLPFFGRFLVLSGIALAALIVTYFTNTEAAQRIKTNVPDDSESSSPGVSLSSLVFSKFGLILLGVFFVTTGHGVITGQFPNYMKDVFSVPSSSSATALSISAVVSLLILDAVGRWMGKSGPSPVWLVAVFMKIIVMLGLGFLSFSGAGLGALIPLALYIIYLQGISWADMVQPALAARSSSAGAGMTQGLLMFSIALAYAAGNFIGGASADLLGFVSLTWIVAAVSGIALVFGFLALKSKSE